MLQHAGPGTSKFAALSPGVVADDRSVTLAHLVNDPDRREVFRYGALLVALTLRPVIRIAP